MGFMRLKGRKLFGFGVHLTVDVEDFRGGDGEGFTEGYYQRDGRRAVVDRPSQDNGTLAHEVGHFIADGSGVYLSEDKQVVWERQFDICRDPRNHWYLEYLAGCRLQRVR